MKKFLLTILTIFFAYYVAYNTSGTSEKQGLFKSGNSSTLYKLICAITGKTDTTDAGQVYVRGERYLRDNLYLLALSDMKKVLSIDSTFYDARLVMAKAYLGLGDTVLAISSLQFYLNPSHESPVAFLEMGKILKSKGLADSSLYFFKKSYDLNSSSEEVNYQLALYYYNVKKMDDALYHIDKAIESDSYVIDYRDLRRLIYIRQNKQDLANQEYQFILSINAEYFGNYKEKAEKENVNGNYQAAIENYKLALQEQPDSREILEARAWVYHTLLRYDSALIDFERVVALYPDHLSYFNVAYTLDLLGKVKESVKNYDKSIELKDDYYLSYNNRGYEHYKLKNLKKAEEDYSKSIELKGDYYLNYYNRGLLYYEQKKYTKAIADYQNALKYADKGMNIIYSLALAYDKSNKKTDAVDQYNEFLKQASAEDSARIEYATERVAKLSKK